MAEKTDIQWCDSTVNLTSGCDGCELWSPGPTKRDRLAAAAQRRICYAGHIHERRLAPADAQRNAQRATPLPQLYAPDFPTDAEQRAYRLGAWHAAEMASAAGRHIVHDGRGCLEEWAQQMERWARHEPTGSNWNEMPSLIQDDDTQLFADDYDDDFPDEED